MLTILLSTALALNPAAGEEYGDKKEAKKASVTVEIENVRQDEGEIYVALQTQDEFTASQGTYTETAGAEDEEVEVTFEDVEPGDYAVAVFQDTSGNGSLDMNARTPDEPYGFSGEVQGAPDFSSASVVVEGETEVEVSLRDPR